MLSAHIDVVLTVTQSFLADFRIKTRLFWQRERGGLSEKQHRNECLQKLLQHPLRAFSPLREHEGGDNYYGSTKRAL